VHCASSMLVCLSPSAQRCLHSFPTRRSSDLNWLEQETIDLGQYASPYYMDVNNDGIDDLLVGYQVTDETFHPVNKIAYFEALNRSEEHTSELQSRENLVCRLLLEKKNTTRQR